MLPWLILAAVAAAQPPMYTTTTPTQRGRQMYGAVVIGDYLYLLGGNFEPDEYTDSVDMARIQPDGTLGPWQPTRPLPSPRCYINNTTLALNDTLYVVQGTDMNAEGSGKVKTILWSRPGPDGHLQPWQESIPCPTEGVSCAVAVATQGYIHLIGGSVGGSTPTQTVWSARIAPDGSVAAWEPGPPLPVPLWFHSAGAVHPWLYVYGGLTSSAAGSVSTDVYAAPILPNGQIGPWQVTPGKLDQGIYTAACAVSGNYLISFCPRYAGASISGDVWFAIAGPQGLSPWTRVEANIPSKLYIGVATDRQRGTVYLPGGRANKEPPVFDKTVYSFALAVGQNGGGAAAAAAPPPAYPAASGVASAPDYTAASTGAAMIPGGGNGYAQQPNPNAYTGAVPAQSGYSVAPPTAVSPSGQPNPAVASTDPPQVFIPYESAKQLYAQQPRPCVIYFHSARDPQCQEQARLLNTLPPQVFPATVLFSQVDPFAAPQTAQQHGVTRIPAWVLYDAQGNLLDRRETPLNPEQFAQFLARVPR